MAQSSVSRRLISAGLWLSGGVMLGRVAGFLREVAIASTMGVSREADISILILTLPDFLVNILMGGAMAAALIPEFKLLKPGEARRLFTQSTIVVAITFSIAAAILALNAQTMVELFAPGFDAWSTDVAAGLMRVVFWLIPLTALAGVSTALLQANGRFAVPALGTLIVNTVLIVTLFIFVDLESGLMVLAAAVLIGGALRWGSQLINLSSTRIWTPARPGALLIKKALLTRYAQALGAGGVLLVLPVIARAVASYHGAGGLATFNYSSKLIEMPLAVFLSVFAVALFPSLSGHFAGGREDEASKLSRTGIILVFIISLPMTLVMAWFSGPLTSIVFEWGALSAEAAGDISTLVKIAALSLPAQGLSALLVAIFNSRRDPGTTLLCSIIGLLLFIPLTWLLWGEAALAGIMASLAVTYWAVFICQLYLLRRRHGIDFLEIETVKAIGRVVLVSVVIFIPFVLISRAFHGDVVWNVIVAVISGAVMLGANLIVINRNGYPIMEILRHGRR